MTVGAPSADPGRGWEVLRDWLHPEQVDDIRGDLAALEQLDPATPDLYVYRERSGRAASLVRIERFVEHARVVGADGLLGRLQDLASAWLGAPAQLFKDKINYRNPGSDGFGPHQDVSAGWLAYASRFVSIGLFPDGSTPTSGGMVLVDEPLPTELQDNHEGQLPQEYFDSRRRVHATIGPRDVLLLDGMSPHRSCRNESPHRVRNVFLTWCAGATGDPRSSYYADKLSTFPDRHADGAYEFRLFRYEENPT